VFIIAINATVLARQLQVGREEWSLSISHLALGTSFKIGSKVEKVDDHFHNNPYSIVVGYKQ
jgi:hypothetical protein